MQRVTITIDDALAADLERYMTSHGYANRSEAVRDLARSGLQQQAVQSKQPCVAALIYVYDHHQRELPKRLTRNFHNHHDLTQATLHRCGVPTRRIPWTSRPVRQSRDRRVLLRRRRVRLEPSLPCTFGDLDERHQSGLTLPCAGAPAHEKSLKNSPWNALTRMTCQLPSVQAREIIKELASSSSQEDKQRQRDQTRFAGLLEVVRCPQNNGSTLLHIGFIKIL
jgi:Arc/MetJ-type ribon-helix-helix transcriptional regulator